jgi:hypothetical protein
LWLPEFKKYRNPFENIILIELFRSSMESIKYLEQVAQVINDIAVGSKDNASIVKKQA